MVRWWAWWKIYPPLCASFAQVSFNVIVRLKINLPPLSLSGAHEAHLTFFSQDQWQAKLGILRAQLSRHAAEGAFGAGDEGGSFVRLAQVMSVLLHTSINCCTDFISCVVEMASRFTGSPRLSQTAQRVANGR
jgi:hypothetical protein